MRRNIILYAEKLIEAARCGLIMVKILAPSSWHADREKPFRLSQCGCSGLCLVRSGQARTTSAAFLPSHIPGLPVVDRYYRELLNFCIRTVKDRETAADIVQESYARVLAAQQSGIAIVAPRPLLYQTARRLMIDLHRRLQIRKHEHIDTLVDVDQPPSPRHLQPDAVYEYAEHARAIMASIETLPPRCREAFVLNRLQGYSHQEVSERMGISKNMVAQHIIRGVLVCKACEDELSGEAREKLHPARRRK